MDIKRIFFIILIGVFLGMSPEASYARLHAECTDALTSCLGDVKNGCNAFSGLGKSMDDCKANGCHSAVQFCRNGG